MKWTKNKSITLTMVCVVLAALALLDLDIFGTRLISWYIGFRGMQSQLWIKLVTIVYAASIFGWGCLISLWNLLRNIRHGEVFTKGNVNQLRIISWTIAGAAIIFLAGGYYYPPFLVVGCAAAFMMLIVRVVKNVFQQAVEMKSELDLTI